MAAATLHSMANLQIETADVYLEFDETTFSSRYPLTKFIENLPFQVTLHDFRLDSFEMWREASLELKGNDLRQLLLFTNEDHLLLPGAEHELTYIAERQAKIQKDHPNQNIMVPLSHFPESHALIPLAKLAGRFKEVGNTPLVPCQIPGGPILISQLNFQMLFVEDFTGGSKFVGLENPFGNSLRLTNGLYLPPRTEIFRHFDSYGHVQLNTWPFNLIEPNVQVGPGSEPARIDFEYRTSSSLENPGGDLLKTLATEEDAESNAQDRLSMAIFKAGSKRPSLDSARWVASKHQSPDIDVVRLMWHIIRRSRNYRIAAAARLWQFPGHLALGVMGRLATRFRSLNLEYTWFLTYGSGIGFVRLFKKSWPNLTRKFRGLFES